MRSFERLWAAVIGSILLVTFQNCGLTRGFKTQTFAGSSYCGANPGDIACSRATAVACSFDGRAVGEGASVTAYLNPTAGDRGCASELRACTNGALSGSYAYATCDAGAAQRACLFNGQTIPSGQSVTGFLQSNDLGTACVSELRTCTDGVLSGGYAFASCTPGAPAACVFNGVTIPHGHSVNGFATSTVPAGQACTPTVRTCLNGALTGSGDFGTCGVSQPASCVFDGRTLADGQATTAFTTPTVPAGQVCAPTVRVCANGMLTGAGDFAACTPAQPAACLINGQTLASGGALTLFMTTSAPYGGTCQAEVRTCSNGQLSGSATATSCQPAGPFEVIFQQGAVTDVESVFRVNQKVDSGRLGITQWFANPQRAGGQDVVVDWAVGDFTGFYPVDRAKAQRGVSESWYGSTAVQAEGDTMGILIHTQSARSASTGPGTLFPIVAGYDIPYGAQPLPFTDARNLVSYSIDIQIPRVSEPAAIFYADQYLAFVDRKNNISFWYGSANYDVRGNDRAHEYEMFDSTTHQPIILAVANSDGAYSQSVGEGAGFQPATWTGFRTFRFVLGYANMKNAIAAAIRVAALNNAPSNYSPNPEDYALVHFNFNPEISTADGNGDAWMGVSFKNIQIAVVHAPQPRGFFRVGSGDGVFYSNGYTAFCGFSDSATFFAWGGARDFSNVTSVAALPITMTNNGACR